MRQLVKLALVLAAVVSCGGSQGGLRAERLYFNDKKVPEGRADLLAIQGALQKHLGRARSATVCLQVGGGSGTGVFISEEGLILTAAHVVGGVKKEVTVVMEDGSKYKAVSMGLNSETDAAMVKIVDADRKFPFVEYERKSSDGKPVTKVGDWVFAMGHSGGFDKERGSVVRLGRMIRMAEHTIQSDCKLIGGDSGGPLFDLQGRLIAIHSRVGKQLASNMHVPLQVFHAGWGQMENSEFIGSGPFAKKPVPGSGFLGVAVEDTDAGVVVSDVEPDSPAGKAELKLGDLIVKINGEKISSKKVMGKLLGKLAVGDKVHMVCKRGEENLEISVELSTR